MNDKMRLLRDSAICAAIFSIAASVAMSQNASYLGGNGLGSTTYVSGPSNPTGTANGLPVQCISGCSGGGGGGTITGPFVSNASSGVATGATNLPNVSYNYAFNGTTWDQLQVDGSKFLEVNVAAGLPLAGASTQPVYSQQALVVGLRPTDPLITAISSGVYTFGTGVTFTTGIGIGGQDSATSTTFDQFIVDHSTGALKVLLANSSITTTGTTTVLTATTGGATPYHFISTASTNSTLISTGAHTLYSASFHGLNTTVSYFRLYDSASAPTCSSATGAIGTFAVVTTSGLEGGILMALPAQGIKIVNGLGFCITGGSADTDNTNAQAGVIANLSYQ